MYSTRAESVAGSRQYTSKHRYAGPGRCDLVAGEESPREAPSVSAAGFPGIASGPSGGALDRRKVTRTLPGRFSNWPRIHTGP